MARIAIVASVAAFLDLIALSEGTSKAPNTHNDGYDIIVNGIDGEHNFSDYSAHPFAAGRPPIQVNHNTPPGLSTASGRYQIILPTWRNIAAARGLGTFSPQNQDLAAMELLAQCAALNFITHGQIIERSERRARLGQLPRQQLRPGRAHARLAAAAVRGVPCRAVVERKHTHA